MISEAGSGNNGANETIIYETLSLPSATTVSPLTLQQRTPTRTVGLLDVAGRRIGTTNRAAPVVIRSEAGSAVLVPVWRGRF